MQLRYPPSAGFLLCEACHCKLIIFGVLLGFNLLVRVSMSCGIVTHFHLEDWLNGYKKNCKSEFELLMERCSRSVNLSRAKRLGEIEASMSDAQRLVLGVK